MKITPDLLTASNGWEKFVFTYRKVISKKIALRFWSNQIYLKIGESEHIPLPNIRTMEQLAQLEYLLSATPAPPNAALADKAGAVS